MAQLYQTPPSKLTGIEDSYEAYCLDEAIADYIGRIREKQRLKPPKTTDNRKLIEEMGGDHK